MYKLFCIFVIILSVSYLDARLTADDCKVPPDSKCTANFGEPVSKPHGARYVFNWDQQKCKVVLWAYDCPYPQNANNFATKEDCNAECSGWA
ncbi:hypothetical protein ABMA28_007336 [Loxostege sticticalis]